MQLKKKLIYSTIISAATLITSIFIPIIPTKTAPGVPNPIYKWTLSSLNPDQINTLGSIKEYFGYTTVLSEAYILTLLITFIVSMVFFHYTTRKRNKH
mgnify:CR=1|jgi:hypothetical protein